MQLGKNSVCSNWLNTKWWKKLYFKKVVVGADGVRVRVGVGVCVRWGGGVVNEGSW